MTYLVLLRGFFSLVVAALLDQAFLDEDGPMKLDSRVSNIKPTTPVDWLFGEETFSLHRVPASAPTSPKLKLMPVVMPCSTELNHGTTRGTRREQDGVEI